MTVFLEFLLGQEPSQLADGTFSFRVTNGATLLLVGVILIIGLAWLVYLRTTAPVSRLMKTTLIGTRALILMLLLFCLLQPQLITSTLIPQESYIAVVADNSRSMAIADMGGGQTRSEVVSELVDSEGDLIPKLRENYRVRTFRFDTDTHRITQPQDLTFQGTRTSLAQSLEHVAEALKGFPVSGVVLLSDGGDNSLADPIRSANLLKSQNIPVFTVGIGQENLNKDIEITGINTVKTVMEGSIFDVHIRVRHEGYEGREVELLIEAKDQVVTSKTIKLGKSGTIGRHTLPLTSAQAGPFVYKLRIPEAPGEIITQNNERLFLVNNQQQQTDLLYIEGHPRHEYKFIQRALKGDQALRLATYLQTGPRKFLRQGIRSPEELANGFPQTKEALYQYEAVIFGDISRAFFSTEQLAMMQDFVSTRGGGFLILGGATAFEDNFINTPIAEILPVVQVPETRLPSELRSGARKGEHATGKKFTLHLTTAGEASPLMRLGIEAQVNRDLWAKMPQLQGINVTGHAKPGATVLATHPTLRYEDIPLPVIAYERYGRGRTMAIMTASTWRWQMLLPHEDLSHERFWRQIARWLVVDSLPRFALTFDQESYSVGETVTVQARLFDKTYLPVDDATVWLKITDASGAIQDLQLKWDIAEEGIYQGTFIVEKQGVFHLEASATTPAREIQETSNRFLVTPSNREYTNPNMDAALLRKISAASGGKFYTNDTIDQLLEDLTHMPNAYSVEVEEALWDRPLILLILFVLFTLEWINRRRKGLS